MIALPLIACCMKCDLYFLM